MEYDIEQIEKQNEKRKRTKQIVKKLLFVIIIILLYNIFLITKSTLDKTDAKSMFGYRAYVITTNSMEPTINVGDIIIVSGIEKDKIKTDKIVTFEQNNQIIMETTALAENKYQKYEKLYISKETGKPEKMEIKDTNQNTIIYIIYNEININTYNANLTHTNIRSEGYGNKKRRYVLC